MNSLEIWLLAKERQEQLLREAAESQYPVPPNKVKLWIADLLEAVADWLRATSSPSMSSRLVRLPV